MAANRDIQLLNNDLIFKNGDLFIDVSDQQHIQDTLNAFPGWWKENPLDGVGIYAYAKSPGQGQELSRNIKINLQSDGYTVGTPQINYSNGTLAVNPNATKL